MNYIQPLFAILLILAHASQCIKTTYNILILAGGHYKQTQHCHVISAILNFVISIITVKYCGLIGVAIGTAVSMVYQMTWMAWYDSKHLLQWSFLNFIKQIVVDIFTAVLIVVATSWIKLTSMTYISWFVMAIEVALIAFVITIAAVCVFQKEKAIGIYNIVKSRKGSK